jgi:serine protease Do
MKNSKKNQEQLTQRWRQISFFVFCFIIILIYGQYSPAAHAQNNAIESFKKIGNSFTAVAKKVSPSVVFIKVEKIVDGKPVVKSSSPFEGRNPLGDEFLKHFFGYPYNHEPQHQQRMVGQGSGFILSKDGYILTNNHVVGDADKVIVKLQDGREYTARTIGTDPHSDIAMIKINAKELPAVDLGDSDTLEEGEWVLAIGNPFGLSHTLTAGIVSAKGRSGLGLADYENFIQTDAAINPGNSGGPLVNLDGEVIGINTAIFTRNGGYMGIGFAIPINMVKAIKDQLIKTGSVARGYLGIIIQDLTPELKESFGLDDLKGVLIAEVTKDSPAEKSGLKHGDVIVEFDDKPVKNVSSFRNRVSLKAAGSKEKIIILRDKQSLVLNVTIGKLPGNDLVADAASHTLAELGITVKNLTPDLADQLGYQGEKGVVITQVNPGTIAALAGLRPGTLIQEVNRKQVQNINEFKQALTQNGEEKLILLHVRDGEYSHYLTLRSKK